MPPVPAPEDIEPTSVRLRGADCSARRPMSTRGTARSTSGTSDRSGPEVARDPSLGPAANVVGRRADGQLPDDPLLHVCLMTYASDMTLLDTVLLAHGASWEGGLIAAASLDHAMWFHRPFRADQWLLYVQDSPSAVGGLGLAQGEVFTQEGKLAVSVVQRGPAGGLLTRRITSRTR